MDGPPLLAYFQDEIGDAVVVRLRIIQIEKDAQRLAWIEAIIENGDPILGNFIAIDLDREEIVELAIFLEH